MARTSGYGMDAKSARDPGGNRERNTVSSPDSGKPGEQYPKTPGPGDPARVTRDAGDAGKPTAQH